jgi:hypothetical protein
MDDATSSPSDSVSTTTSTATAERTFAAKPRRLARGLNDLFARQSAHKPALPAAPSGPQAAEPAAAPPVDPAATAAAPAVPVTVEIAPITAARTGAAEAIKQPEPVKVEPAQSYEYRFVQLITRLDATCNLLADARQTHLVAAQRNTKIAWGVAAGLAIVAGVSLWWAGSIAAWNKSKLEYESMRSAALEQSFTKLTAQHAVTAAGSETITRQHETLSRQHAALAKQNEAVRAEIETIRTSLLRANAVIDELMSKPVESNP